MISKMIFISRVILHRDKDQVFTAIGKELDRVLPNGRRCCDGFVRELLSLPIGLRSMASTYELDVSITLDDLGWHFGNWPNKELAKMTIDGLVELGLQRHAELFNMAYVEVQKDWDKYSVDLRSWYHGSDLEYRLTSINKMMWALNKGDNGILASWVPYAKRSIRKLM